MWVLRNHLDAHKNSVRKDSVYVGAVFAELIYVIVRAATPKALQELLCQHLLGFLGIYPMAISLY